MSEEAELKQQYLRSEIIDQGYDPEEFSQFLVSQKGEDACDIDNWTMSELEEIVKMFINNHNMNNQNQNQNLYQGENQYESQPIQQSEIINIDNNPADNAQVNEMPKENTNTNQNANLSQSSPVPVPNANPVPEANNAKKENPPKTSSTNMRKILDNASTTKPKPAPGTSTELTGFETFSDKEISDV